ncbi:peptidoglycan-recognition protein SB2 isoform X2 [Amyelois transitella]|uniref:peptidoglycan-recognition protein SB2 isoform X2 n=1 Tax=Amyelois transitella TaxID=680683 RepID=UPI00067C1F11|nr:peptidoglycan-recognition protein SB2 isoform X2 [Amyelois transitella]
MWRDSSSGRSSAGSEVVMMENSPISSLRVSDIPNVASLNVTNSPQFHLGPKIYNVNQTVHRSEVIKGQVLGLELVSAPSSRHLRCSVAVFVCWAFLVTCALAFIIFYFALYKEQTRLDIGLKEPWYLRRGDWQAMPPYAVEFLQLPIRNVIIGHSATKSCADKYSCIESMLSIQQDHLRRDYDDIGPNYLISADGLLFEGRGANVKPAMVKLWNSRSITVMFLGNYVNDTTQLVQFEHLNILFDVLVKEEILHRDYVIYGFCQISTFVVSPGPEIMKQMNRFSHWNSTDANKCLPE